MCSSAGKSPGLGKTGRGEMERRARAFGCRGRMWGAWCGGASRWPCTRQGVLPQFPHPKLWLPLKMPWKPRSPPKAEEGMGRERTQVNNHLDTARRCSREPACCRAWVDPWLCPAGSSLLRGTGCFLLAGCGFSLQDLVLATVVTFPLLFLLCSPRGVGTTVRHQVT